MYAPIKHSQSSQSPEIFDQRASSKRFTAPQVKFVTSIRRSLRILRIAAHVICGLCTVTLRFPRYDQAQRDLRISRWSSQLTEMLGLRVKIHGIPPKSGQRTLILANHISWVDIVALNAISTARFVAKSEVGHWPLIGRLCRGTGTLFIERNNKRDTARLNHEIVAALEAGQNIAVFPEGTSSDGSALRPFRSSLLQPAIDCQTTIQPVYLRYVDAYGSFCCAAAYCDDISFGASMWKLLAEKGITAELHYLEPISVSGSDDRRALANDIQTHIRAKQLELSQAIADSLQRREPEISRHHPAAPQLVSHPRHNRYRVPAYCLLETGRALTNGRR